MHSGPLRRSMIWTACSNLLLKQSRVSPGNGWGESKHFPRWNTSCNQTNQTGTHYTSNWNPIKQLLSSKFQQSIFYKFCKCINSQAVLTCAKFVQNHITPKWVFYELVVIHCQWNGSNNYISVWLMTLRLRQDCHHFTQDIFKFIFLTENVWILLKISLKFVPEVRINNISALATSHYLNQWWLIYWCILASLSLNELIDVLPITDIMLKCSLLFRVMD